MKKLLFSLLMMIGVQASFAQTLEKMQWFNEPEQWEIKDKSLSMFVTPQSDYWRISHYGFTVDDAPFYYATYGGEFEVKVKVTGDYKARFDQAGLMLDKPVPYIWIKAVRRLDAVEIFYSFDDKTYTMMRNAWLQDNIPVKVGFMAACPDGGGFNVKFENFKVKHLPDMRRLEWLKKNAE